MRMVQVMFVRPNGSIMLAGVEQAPPAYQRMVELIQGIKGSKTSQTWVDRVFPSKRFGERTFVACAIKAPANCMLEGPHSYQMVGQNWPGFLQSWPAGVADLLPRCSSRVLHHLAAAV